MVADKIIYAKKWMVASALILLSHCATTDEQSKQNRPLTREELSALTVEALIELAVSPGRNSVVQIAAEIYKKREPKKVAEIVAQNLTRAEAETADFRLWNFGKLSYLLKIEFNQQQVMAWLSHRHEIVRRIAWRLASFGKKYISDENIEVHVAGLVNRGRESSLFVPEFAEAIGARQLRNYYSLVRQGLMETGLDAFATSLIRLNPKAASSDFLVYLSSIPVEDLRQMSQESMKPETVVVIFDHLGAFTPSPSNSMSSYLFVYTISRNMLISEKAQEILEKMMRTDAMTMAIYLARMDEWIQTAFVETARKNLNPTLKSFLMQLKEYTPHQYVVADISSIPE